MEETTKRICLAGNTLKLYLRYPETERYFRRFQINSNEQEIGSVSVSGLEFEDWAASGNSIDEFAEFCLLCQPVSEALLPNGCVFHAAALHFRGKAFLLAGGSGVGKSTFTRLLMQAFPDEITVINGDKPVLTCDEGGIITAHPSPWNGKEGWRGAEAAPLGGVIFLRRGEETSICEIEKEKAGVFAYPLVFQSFTDEIVMKMVAAMTESIVEAVPCWLLTSGDINVAFPLLEQAIREAENDDL